MTRRREPGRREGRTGRGERRGVAPPLAREKRRGVAPLLAEAPSLLGEEDGLHAATSEREGELRAIALDLPSFAELVRAELKLPGYRFPMAELVSSSIAPFSPRLLRDALDLLG